MTTKHLIALATVAVAMLASTAAAAAKPNALTTARAATAGYHNIDAATSRPATASSGTPQVSPASTSLARSYGDSLREGCLLSRLGLSTRPGRKRSSTSFNRTAICG